MIEFVLMRRLAPEDTVAVSLLAGSSMYASTVIGPPLLVTSMDTWSFSHLALENTLRGAGVGTGVAEGTAVGVAVIAGVGVIAGVTVALTSGTVVTVEFESADTTGTATSSNKHNSDMQVIF